MLRSVPNRMLTVAGNFDEVSRTGFDPIQLSGLFHKHFNIPIKNKEIFDHIVTVQGYGNTGRDRSFEYARGFVPW
jgi:hypothetical protein